MWKTIGTLALSILVAEGVGVLGAIATASSVETWYPTLEKPWFTPPNWLFGPAWTTLYAMMAVAAWLVWRADAAPGAVQLALGLYVFQLALNAAWSPVFFGMQALGWGLVVIVLLWLAIVATIVAFARVSAPAAWLMVPYLAWVTYASALNFSLWQLN